MSKWDEARVATLRQRWGEGASASEIARELNCGFTSNAVIGKVHRLVFSRSVDVARTTASAAGKMGAIAQRASARAAAPRLKQAPVVAPKPHPAVERSARASNSPPIDSGRITILEVRDGLCRWPLGDPSSPSFRFCGETIAVECGPYCETHRGIAYTPRLSRKAEAA